MTISFLQKSLGGKLTHTVADLSATGGRWDSTTAPTVVLYNRGGGELVASTACDLGIATVLSAAAAADQKSITVGTTSGVVRWDDYVVGPNISGQWEWVTVDGITSTAVTLVDDLTYAYSSGRAFKSHTMSITLTGGDVPTVNRDCFASWAYNVDGESRKDSTTFHVSLYAPRLSLTPAMVIQEYPRADKIISDQQRIGLLIREKWRTRVLVDIGHMWAPGALVSGEVANEALLFKVVQHIARQARDMEGADMWGGLYLAALDSLRSTIIDLDESGGVGDDEIPRGVATPRLLRG